MSMCFLSEYKVTRFSGKEITSVEHAQIGSSGYKLITSVGG